MDSPFTPKHKPNAQFELRWHPKCGHVAWSERANQLPNNGVGVAEVRIPLRLPTGAPCCLTCAYAQKNPGIDQARLVWSTFDKRLTAIGFGKARKDELKALKFQLVKEKEGQGTPFWVFHLPDSDIAGHRFTLARDLGCIIEMADATLVPPVPLPEPAIAALKPAPRPESAAATEPSLSTLELALPTPETKSDPVPAPTVAIIVCKGPGLPIHTQKDAQARVSPIYASISWPPRVEDIPEVTVAGLPPETPRMLLIPSLPNLISLGYCWQDLLQLARSAAFIDVAIHSADDLIDLTTLIPALKLFPLGHELSSAPHPVLAKSKGGRPATARIKGPDVLRLVRDGWTVARIAKELGIHARSVRRILQADLAFPQTSQVTAPS